MKATVTRPSPDVTPTRVGASGERDGMAFVAVELVPAPIRFTARTVTGYRVPFANELIVNEVVADPVVTQVDPSVEC